MPEFIFMLTHHDRTLEDALDVYDGIRDMPLRYVGFKDVGVPHDTLRELARRMHSDGREVMLEVVSERAEDELRSVATACDIGVDWVLGGTHPDEALDAIGTTDVRYCPFPGRVIGHPSLLRGTHEEIAASARELTARDGVHGLDLLAYRYDGDVEAMTAKVIAAASGPVIAAGSVDSVERIRTLGRLGAWGFTIGGAIFEGRLPTGPSVRDQLALAIATASEVTGGVGASDPV
ncbi:MAG TPA: hypothetical protein VFI69_03575 [Candidatus Limnocylindrales bacterium]|nr:hypothetical protein [Candidatus Limnocylindrales bacterium]